MVSDIPAGDGKLVNLFYGVERGRWDETAITSKVAFCHRKSNKASRQGKGEVTINFALAGEIEMGLSQFQQQQYEGTFFILLSPCPNPSNLSLSLPQVKKWKKEDSIVNSCEKTLGRAEDRGYYLLGQKNREYFVGQKNRGLFARSEE